ncbi:MAG: sigma-70 family RNA polymerase sigma factor, partial [Planctomycetes bacterium]|nr:sigma-70 family RNA polymerase sigma factor [Planctomycetota bacterium]
MIALTPPPRTSALDLARSLCERFGDADPLERYGVSVDDRRRALDAATTALMDLYRRTHDDEVFEGVIEVARPFLTRRIRARIHTLGARLDPAEVLQDVIINVYRYPDRFDGARAGAFRAWSSMIVDNAIRRQLRRSKSGPDVQLRPLELLTLEPDQRGRDPLACAESVEACERAVSALRFFLAMYLAAYRQLSDRERFVLQMVEVRGMR